MSWQPGVDTSQVCNMAPGNRDRSGPSDRDWIHNESVYFAFPVVISALVLFIWLRYSSSLALMFCLCILGARMCEVETRWMSSDWVLCVEGHHDIIPGKTRSCTTNYKLCMKLKIWGPPVWKWCFGLHLVDWYCWRCCGFCGRPLTRLFQHNFSTMSRLWTVQFFSIAQFYSLRMCLSTFLFQSCWHV